MLPNKHVTTAFILLLFIESSMKVNLFASVLSCLILGCHDSEVVVKSHQMGEKADHSICWLTWEDSELPIIQNLPNARFWNDSIAAYEAHVKNQFGQPIWHEVKSNFLLWGRVQGR